MANVNDSSRLSKYEQELLSGWEEVYKRGQLTLWIMLALQDGPKHMAVIKQFITIATKGMLSADDQSMYRALRRYYDIEFVTYEVEPRDRSTDRKLYRLTKTGERVLAEFIERNVLHLLEQSYIKKRKEQ